MNISTKIISNMNITTKMISNTNYFHNALSNVSRAMIWYGTIGELTVTSKGHRYKDGNFMDRRRHGQWRGPTLLEAWQRLQWARAHTIGGGQQLRGAHVRPGGGETMVVGRGTAAAQVVARWQRMHDIVDDICMG